MADRVNHKLTNGALLIAVRRASSPASRISPRMNCPPIVTASPIRPPTGPTAVSAKVFPKRLTLSNKKSPKMPSPPDCMQAASHVSFCIKLRGLLPLAMFFRVIAVYPNATDDKTNPMSPPYLASVRHASPPAGCASHSASRSVCLRAPSADRRVHAACRQWGMT